MMHSRHRAKLYILGYSIHRPIFRTRIIIIGKRCTCIIFINRLHQTWEIFLHTLQKSLGMKMLEFFVVCTSLADLRSFPSLHIGHMHIRKDDPASCILLSFFVAEMHIEISFRPILRCIFLTTPWCFLVIAIEIIIHIGHLILLETKINGESTNRIRDLRDTFSIHRA